MRNSNNPLTPNPNPPTKNPLKTGRQWTVKNNGKMGEKWEFINVTNSKERVLIDDKNKVFYSSPAFYVRGDQFTISFNEEDATKEKGYFVFEESNDKFRLTPLTIPTPPAPQPSPGGPKPRPILINFTCKWNGSVKDGYWLFVGNSKDTDKLRINIAKNHPFFKNKKLDHTSDTPLFYINFLEKDASRKEGDNEWYFEADNNGFNLAWVGDWPDEPNSPSPPIPNPTPQNEQVVVYRGENSKFCLFDDMTGPILANQKTNNFKVNKERPQIKKLQLQSFKKFIIRYGLVDSFEDNGEVNAFIFTFNKNNLELEIAEV